jgi:PAS domain-containing protein
LLDVRFRRVWIAQVLLMMSVLVSCLAVIGYVCDVPEFYAQADRLRGNGVSVQETAGFLMLAAGLLSARVDRGLAAVIWSHTPGGMLPRGLLAAPALGLLLTGVVYLVLDRGLHVDHVIRTWALGLSNLIFVTAPIWVAAQGMHRAGLERDRAYQLLEERVQQRTSELTAVNAALQAEITDRRQAEQALRLSEERYRVVADNTYAMEYWLGPDGAFIYVSPSCERITGYAPAEFLSHPDLLARVVHADDRKLLQAQGTAALGDRRISQPSGFARARCPCRRSKAASSTGYGCAGRPSRGTCRVPAGATGREHGLGGAS